MPVNRYRPGQYVTNGSGGALNHGQPAKEGNFVGVCVKQKAPKWSDGLSAQKQIANGEKYYLITKGEVQVDFVAGFSVGDAIYITSGNVLTKTAASNTPYGRVVEVAADNRGVPTGKVRIDLDIKTAVAAATF